MSALLDRLADHLEAHADARPPVRILQPADPFLDTVGEDMRRRLFVTEGLHGEPLCLRPEFTIPLCLHHIQRDELSGASYACAGTVFRQGREGAEEFEQAGLELLGHLNTAQADAECMGHFADALAFVGQANAGITLGDKALFEALVTALDLTPTWSDRLLRAFGEPDQLESLFAQLGAPPLGAPDDPVRRLAVEGDALALEAHVRDRMTAGGLSEQSGRDPARVAARAIARERDAALRLDPIALHTLRSFLAVDQPLPEALDSIEVLATVTDLDLSTALRALRERCRHLAARDLDPQRLRFRAGFGRPLDYYTGILFEAARDGTVLGGGGRYDRLCTVLGGATPTPAVGFSIAVDRISTRPTGRARA